MRKQKLWMYIETTEWVDDQWTNSAKKASSGLGNLCRWFPLCSQGTSSSSSSSALSNAASATPNTIPDPMEAEPNHVGSQRNDITTFKTISIHCDVEYVKLHIGCTSWKETSSDTPFTQWNTWKMYFEPSLFIVSLKCDFVIKSVRN